MNWADIAWALTWPPMWTLMMYAVRRKWQGRAAAIPGVFGSWLAGCFGVLVSAVITRDWTELAIGVALAAAALLWHWWRKRRDRIAALLGAKSRALRDALVRKQRELTRRCPVLRPVPGGAG